MPALTLPLIPFFLIALPWLNPFTFGPGFGLAICAFLLSPASAALFYWKRDEAAVVHAEHDSRAVIAEQR